MDLHEELIDGCVQWCETTEFSAWDDRPLLLWHLKELRNFLFDWFLLTIVNIFSSFGRWIVLGLYGIIGVHVFLGFVHELG